MSEENNRWGSQREYLQTGQTIRLSPGKDGRNGKTWQILSVLGEGASAVCYEAVCADDEGETLGVLKEFYPVSTRSGDRVWSYSMKRQASGQLVPCGTTTQSFAALRDAYIDAYRRLQQCVRTGRDGGAPNTILNNYIQDARILYGCPDNRSDRCSYNGPDGCLGNCPADVPGDFSDNCPADVPGDFSDNCPADASGDFPDNCLDGSLDGSGAKDEADLPSVYIWSRALHGVSFEQYLDEVRKEPGEESDKKLLDILETVHTVADSVKAIHEAGLLHLDIKPSNFLVLYDSSHRLMPNHISLFDIDTMHPVGGDFPVRGTEGYAAPEVRRGETALCWADIYSIGAMLFHAVVMMEPGSGELPDDRYQDRYYKNIGYYVNHSQLIRGAQSNSDVRLMALLVRILRKCLAYRWEDRYGSCEELLGDLEKVIGRLRLYTLPAGALGPDEQMRVVTKTVDTGIVMQKLLYRYPVQEHVLVVGAGTYGQKFIDQCLQAGQSKDALLKIRALSDTPEEDAAMYLQFRPALTDFTRVTVDGERVDTAADGSVTSLRRLVRDRSVREGSGQERSGSVTPGPESLGWVRSGREGLSQELSGSKKAGIERPGQKRLVPERPDKRENGVCYAQIDFESFVIVETSEDDQTLNQSRVRALLTPTVRYDCVFIALGEDARNRSIAELFAKELACKDISCPVCYVCEREPENLRGTAGGSLWGTEHGNLHPVWVNEPLTPGQISPSLERMAFQTHLCWDRSPNRDISDIYEKFIKDKYNYASSMAYALSIKAKLRSIGITIESEDEEGYRRAAEQFQKQILNHLHPDKREEEKTDLEKEAEAKFATLVALEHRRWLMEKAADGWRAPKYRNGEIKYADCIVRGKVKDDINHVHPCMVPSTEKMPLSQECYQRNHHEKWENPDDPDRMRLDPLDRMSVELHQCFANYADSFRQSAPLDGGDMEILRQLILPQEEEAGRALRQYEFCLKNILNGAENDSRQYDRWERNLLETAKALDEERRTKIEERVRLIRKAFFPVIESNLYRDYKANDEIQIRMLPFILTGQFPVRSLAVSFANPASTEEEKECLMANIASVDILSPKQLYYLNYIQNDAQADAFLQNLRGVFAYLDRRAIRREVSLFLVIAKEGGRMERELKAYMQERDERFARERSDSGEGWLQRKAGAERKQSDSGAVKFVRYELCVCESESLAAKQFAKWLKEYDVRWLDDSAPLFEARENIAAFRFDRQCSRFTDCRGCRELLYIEDSSYIRIDDYQALTGERVEPCVFPEYENDCEVLWNLCEAAPDAWDMLCGMLTEYETHRPALAILQVKTPGDGDITGEAGMPSDEAGAVSEEAGTASGEAGVVSDRESGALREEEGRSVEDLAELHTCFLPNYTYHTVERLLAQLKEYGVIGENSSVRRYASDTCMLNVICEPAVWQALYSVLRKPQQLIDYYGVTAVKAAESDAEIRIVGNPLEVREMKAVFGEANHRKADAEDESVSNFRELGARYQPEAAHWEAEAEMRKNRREVEYRGEVAKTDAENVWIWKLLTQLQDAGYILDLCVSEDTSDRMVSEDKPFWSVSFSYSSLRIKELLTTRGALQAVHAYYEILKSGCADDVRYIKPAREGETMDDLTQVPEVLFSKGYQIFQEKVR